MIYHWKAEIQDYLLIVVVLYYTFEYNSNRAKKSNVEIFHLYFLKWDISFIIPNKLTKLVVANLETLLEGTVCRIFYLRLSFKSYNQKRETLCIFSKLHFLDYIKFDLGPKKII